MSIQILQGYLDDLWILVDNPSSNAVDAAAVCADIKNVTLNEIAPEEAGT